MATSPYPAYNSTACRPDKALASIRQYPSFIPSSYSQSFFIL
ncbi:hypothetical protein HMPREF0208_04676 [Citrobacter koseri]|nr:hypothetical protein HMPREF3220_03906 [Citrobacter koseri]KXA02791.1 hypothetical protein HMPREF3207_02233 [Citrobacter koseri]KXB39665.1 hypothetical protein HMPREF0208_04676 [Citrobacter koseri]